MARHMSPFEEKALMKGRYRQSVFEFGHPRAYQMLAGCFGFGQDMTVFIKPTLNSINMPGLSITFCSVSKESIESKKFERMMKQYDAFWYPSTSTSYPFRVVSDQYLCHFDINLTDPKHCEILTTRGNYVLRNSPHVMSAEAYTKLVRTGDQLLPFQVTFLIFNYLF